MSYHGRVSEGSSADGQNYPCINSSYPTFLGHGKNRTAFYPNPFAFARTIVLTSRLPSSDGIAISAAAGSNIGNRALNILRVPGQFNLNFSLTKRFLQ
jgi:hypothetical protein